MLLPYATNTPTEFTRNLCAARRTFLRIYDVIHLVVFLEVISRQPSSKVSCGEYINDANVV